MCFYGVLGIDAHQHTPVEALHTLLLGFVKYFWRDAMARIKKDQKDLLITRLNSINTAGLGCPPLAGRTLVQFAGSLVGKDFRIIGQIAPFVLFDLLPAESYEAWLALCSLIPLVYQPAIYGLKAYLASLNF